MNAGPRAESLLARAEAAWPRVAVVALALAAAPGVFAVGTMARRGLGALAAQTVQWAPVVLFTLPLAVVVGVLVAAAAPRTTLARLLVVALVLACGLFAVGAALGPTTIPHRKRPAFETKLSAVFPSRTGRLPTRQSMRNSHVIGSHNELSA